MLKEIGKSFVWWIGVVEDRNDPLKIGRVRVRIFHWHSQNMTDVPTAALPWATPLQDITSAAAGDVGRSPTGVALGSWVIGFFIDGDEAQRPVVLGTIAGVPQSGAGRLYEPDVNRLARNDEGYAHALESGLVGDAARSIGVALSDRTWSQPPYTNAGTQYPLNHVEETESGHVEIRNDSPGSEQLLRIHRSGSHEYIDATGGRTVRVKGANYEIISSNNNVIIAGSCNVTIAGDYNLLVKGDMNVQVDGSYNVNVGAVDVRAGSIKATAASVDLTASALKTTAGSYDEVVTGATAKTYGGDYAERFDGDKSTHIGRDTYARHDGGTDYTCPSDPPRESEEACTDVVEGTVATEATVFTTSAANNVLNSTAAAPVLTAVFGTAVPSVTEAAAVTVLDAPVESTVANTSVVQCSEFGTTLTAANYAARLSTYYTLADLTTGALYPHRIAAQHGMTEGQIACNLKALAVNVLDPIRAKYGSRFRINSAFRPVQNGRSDHEFGQAADLQFSGFTRAETLEAAKWIAANIPSYKQVIYENIGNSGGWVHVAYARTRGSNDKIALSTSNGRTYTSGLSIA